MQKAHRFLGSMFVPTSFIWFLMCLILFVTNTTILPNDFLTTISAMDSSIYLGIADSAPGLPVPGSNMVYHGAMRFLVPYVLGSISKIVGMTSWQIFRIAVHVLTLISVGLFWDMTGRLKAHSSIRLLATSLLCFHVYLFRLQLSFSGFVNDAFFVFGFSWGIWSMLNKNYGTLFLSIVIMGIGKQIVFFVLPIFVLWSYLDFDIPVKRLKLGLFWIFTLSSLVGYYFWIHNIILPFSTPGSTKAMALGLIQWIKDTPFEVAGPQLIEFLALGCFGLLGPLLFILSIYLRSATVYSRLLGLLLCLFLFAIVQPYLSGPTTTDRSIMRLEALGVIPLLLAGVVLAAQNGIYISKKVLISTVLLIFMASFHHLFSIVGPNLELRKLFFLLQIGMFAMFINLFYRGIQFGVDEGEE